MLLQVSPSEAKKVREFDAGPWLGEVYVDDQTGKFASCVGSASYKSGISLAVMVHPDYSWTILLWNENWDWPNRKDIGASYRFNGGAWLNVTANSDGKAIFLEMRNDTTSVQLFQHSRDMDVRFFGETVGFNLTKTNNLMSILGDCVAQELAAEEGQPPASSAISKPNAEQKSDKAKKSAESFGTGFLVSPEGHVITNNHVIKGCSSVRVTRTGETARSAVVLRTDETNDLAVLMSEAAGPVSPAILRQSGVRVGDQIATFGFPLAGTLSTSGVLTSGTVSSLAGLNDDVRHFQISAPIQPGNSGGPLLDMFGNVVGITNMKLNELAAMDETGSFSQNVNFAIKANVAVNFLDAHSIPYKVAQGTQAALSLPDIVEKAKSFTVQVSCK